MKRNDYNEGYAQNFIFQRTLNKPKQVTANQPSQKQPINYASKPSNNIESPNIQLSQNISRNKELMDTIGSLGHLLKKICDPEMYIKPQEIDNYFKSNYISMQSLRMVIKLTTQCKIFKQIIDSKGNLPKISIINQYASPQCIKRINTIQGLFSNQKYLIQTQLNNQLQNCRKKAEDLKKQKFDLQHRFDVHEKQLQKMKKENKILDKKLKKQQIQQNQIQQIKKKMTQDQNNMILKKDLEINKLTVENQEFKKKLIKIQNEIAINQKKYQEEINNLKIKFFDFQSKSNENSKANQFSLQIQQKESNAKLLRIENEQLLTQMKKIQNELKKAGQNFVEYKLQVSQDVQRLKTEKFEEIQKMRKKIRSCQEQNQELSHQLKILNQILQERPNIIDLSNQNKILFDFNEQEYEYNDQAGIIKKDMKK